MIPVIEKYRSIILECVGDASVAQTRVPNIPRLILDCKIIPKNYTQRHQDWSHCSAHVDVLCIDSLCSSDFNLGATTADALRLFLSTNSINMFLYPDNSQTLCLVSFGLVVCDYLKTNVKTLKQKKKTLFLWENEVV